jgi:hypothetical protein
MPCFGCPDTKTLFFTSPRYANEAGDKCGNVFMMEVDVPARAGGCFELSGPGRSLGDEDGHRLSIVADHSPICEPQRQNSDSRREADAGS